MEEHAAGAVDDAAVDNYSVDDCNEVTYHPHYYNDIPHSHWHCHYLKNDGCLEH